MKMRRGRIPIDGKLLIKDAAKLIPDPARRIFLSQASLGMLVMLTGCDLISADAERSAEKMLRRISRFNDRVQWLLFNPDKLAPTYAESRIADPFPFNAFYGVERAPVVDGESYALALSGKIENTAPWTLDQLYALPRVSQVTRHICVEGWSAIGKWSGTPLRGFLERVGGDFTAKYVWFRCADGYTTSIDMPTALHPQTQMTFEFRDGRLPRKYGFPMKVRIPTKLGFKNPKHVVEIAVREDYPGGYWEDQGYNWFSGN